MKTPDLDDIVCGICLLDTMICDCDGSDGGLAMNLVRYGDAIARRGVPARPSRGADDRGARKPALREVLRSDVA